MRASILLLLSLWIHAPFASAEEQVPAPRTIRVTGMLLDEHYQPAAGVPITTRNGDQHDLEAPLAAPLGMTGDDGRFAIDITMPGEKGVSTYLILGGKRFAVHEQYLPASSEDLDLGTVALPQGYTALGRVRDAAGNPIAGARIVGTDLLASREFLSNHRHSNRLECRTRCVAPANGIFKLRGMVRSLGEVRITCDGYYDAVIAPAALGSPLDITLQKAPTVHGRVLDGDGKPLANVSVSAGVSRGKTASDGAFALQLREPHVHKVTASLRRNGKSFSQAEPLPEGDATIEVRVAIEAARPEDKVRIQARGPDGEKIDAFEAWLSWNPSDQLQYRPDTQLLARANDDESRHQRTDQGEVQLAGSDSLRNEAGIVFVRAAGHGLGRVEIARSAAGADPVVVTLPRPCTLRGRVVDRQSGEPIAGAEVIPTQCLTIDQLQHHLSGYETASRFHNAPCNVMTDADGRFELNQLAPGETAVLVRIAGHDEPLPLTFDLAEGETKEGVDFVVPRNIALAGKLAATTLPGLQVRAHWHRPDMWSSSWATEFDGATAVARDGSFTLADLPPRLYQLEVILPAPPRGGQRLKMTSDEWDGRTPPEKTAPFALPATALVKGTVAGDVPWSRLAVLATWQDEHSYDSQFAPRGPLALLAPDRSFELLLPERAYRLVLFDAFTGIVLEYRDVPAGDLGTATTWSGKCVPLLLQLRDEQAGDRRPCTIEYQPDEDHWPLFPQRFVRESERKGMRTSVRAGEDLQLWLPARTGELQIQCGGAQWRRAVDAISGDRIEIVLGQESVTLRN